MHDWTTIDDKPDLASQGWCCWDTLLFRPGVGEGVGLFL